MAAAAPHLELREIVKVYGTTRVVDGITLPVYPGEIVSLLGPSGCGKTTTLHMIAGFVKPDGGEIRLRGRPVQTIPPHRRNIAMVFQSYALFPHLTIFENVAFGLRVRKVPGPEIVRRVKNALNLVRLSGVEDKYPNQLSGGQQQRVALARALVVEPDVLLLDEPLSNLDAKLRTEMRSEIVDIQRRLGITTIFVTHDQEEALAISDRVAVMNRGRIEQVGTPDEVYNHPQTAFVAHFIGEVNDLPALVQESEGSLTAVVIEGGGVVRGVARRALPPGSVARMIVRPERINLLPQDSPVPPGRNVVSGTVERLTYLGAVTRYRVRSSAGSIDVDVTNRGDQERFGLGSAVQLVWDPVDTLLTLDAGTGEEET